MNTATVSRPRVRDRGGSWLGWSFFVCLLLVTALGKIFKDTGPIGFAVVLLVSLAYGARELAMRRNVVLLVFALIGTAYIALSYAHMLPGAWTLFWDQIWIFQQSAYVIGLPIIVAASQRWWRDPAFVKHRHVVLAFFALAFFIVGPVIDFVTSSEGVVRPMLGLRNDWMLGVFAVLYLGVFAERRVKILCWMALAGILIASTVQIYFIQTVGCVAFLLICMGLSQLKFDLSRLALILSILLLFAVTLVGFFYLTEIYALDRNTGIRLVFWIDGMRAVQETAGVGVGFGTEALRNEYYDVLPFYREFLSADSQQFPLVGMHNALFDTAFRMGLPGLFLLLYLLYTAFPSRRLDPKASAVACGAFWLMFICLYFNMALQSPMHLIAVGFVLGYLRHINQTIRRTRTRVARPPRDRGPVLMSPSRA